MTINVPKIRNVHTASILNFGCFFLLKIKNNAIEATIKTIKQPVATQWAILLGFQSSILCPRVRATRLTLTILRTQRTSKKRLFILNFLYIYCTFKTIEPDVRSPQIQKYIFLSSQRSDSVPSSDAGLFPQQNGRTSP